jgi:uncharacterized protein GlcG (DUF336 family)
VVALADGDFVPAAGGVLVRDDDNVIGAAGSAGPCPMTTKPAQSTASPPRGLRAAPGAADST